MKKLSSIDIQLKEFARSLRGYDVDQVRTFLDEVSRNIESIDYENRALKEKLREKEVMIMDYRERESMLKETITTAQKVTDSIKNDATREALQIVTQAKLKADGILRESRQNIKKVIDEISRLKKQKMELTSNIGAMLESQLRMLKQFETEDDGLVDLNIPYDTFSSLGSTSKVEERIKSEEEPVDWK